MKIMRKVTTIKMIAKKSTKKMQTKLKVGFVMNCSVYKYILFAIREVRVWQNCANGLGYRPRPQAVGSSQYRGQSFSQYGPTFRRVKNSFIFSYEAMTNERFRPVIRPKFSVIRTISSEYTAQKAKNHKAN